MKDLPRTPSGAIDGNALLHLPVMDTTDYADMLSYISDFAESLELEATYGPGNNHPVTTAAHKASLLLRRAEALLKPLAEADPDDDTAIESIHHAES